MDPNWFRNQVTGHLISKQVEIKGKAYLHREYIANTGIPDLRETGFGWKGLHPHLPPSDTPTFLHELRFALKPDIDPTLVTEIIRCQIITEEGSSPVFEYKFGDLENRPAFRL